MPAIFNVPIRRQQVLLFAVDVGLLLLSLMLAFVMARFAKFNAFFVLDRFTLGTAIYFTVHVVVFFVGQLYDVENRHEEMRSILYIGALVTVANLFIFMMFYFLPEYRIARRVMAIQAPLAVVLIFMWRRVYLLVMRRLLPPRRVVVVGGGETAESLIEELRAVCAPEYEFVGIVGDAGAEKREVPVLGSTGELSTVVSRERIDTILFTPGYPSFQNGGDGDMVRSLLELKARGVRISEMATFYKKLTGKVPVRYIEDQWLLFSQDFAGIARADAKNLKRLMDIFVSIVGLVVLFPVIVVLVLLVKCTSRGPVLYRQERFGLDKKPYALLKFRTMRVDAEKEGQPVWASANDSRVTPVGRVMRRLRLDEIPQFINVLRGEMSVIGPRPERPYFVERLERAVPYYSLRFAAKPGLTGWAQVNYHYGATVEDAHTKLQYDLYYIQEMSPLLDLVILLKTFQTLLFRPGY